MALVDWGLDVAHPDFRREDGTTRVLALWDQRSRVHGRSNTHYGYGWVHDRRAIDRALRGSNPYAALAYAPWEGGPGPSHGTHTTAIAAGSGRSGGPIGMAPEADIVFVHMAPAKGARGKNLGDSVSLLEALDFIARVAGGRPWVTNLSLGNQAGPHDGTTLVEQGIDALLSSASGRAVVHSTGNYFSRPSHTQGMLRPGDLRELRIATGAEDGFAHEIDIWYAGPDRVAIEVSSPDGTLRGRVVGEQQCELRIDGRLVGRLYSRLRDPNNFDNQGHVYLCPDAPRGAWTLRLTGADVVDGRFHCWVERDATCASCQPAFDERQVVRESTTGTICNGYLSVAVGAFDAHDAERPMATFSSSGPTRDGRYKPDLVAPGVNVLSARSASADRASDLPPIERMSGTSMAAPHVTGTLALMLQVAPTLPIRRLRELVLKTAEPLATSDEQFRWGSGYLDVSGAVAAARAGSPQEVVA